MKTALDDEVDYWMKRIHEWVDNLPGEARRNEARRVLRFLRMYYDAHGPLEQDNARLRAELDALKGRVAEAAGVRAAG